jgi:antitoxin component of MazEF toxin-antitoxin module
MLNKSKVVVLPQKYLDYLHVADGEYVKISIEKDRLVITRLEEDQQTKKEG